MPEEQKSPSNPQQAQLVINAPMGVNLLYANGTLVNMSQADVQITLAANGRPTMIAAMSLPTAKTLLLNLDRALKDYERKTNTPIQDLNQLSELLKKP